MAGSYGAWSGPWNQLHRISVLAPNADCCRRRSFCGLDRLRNEFSKRLIVITPAHRADSDVEHVGGTDLSGGNAYGTRSFAIVLAYDRPDVCAARGRGNNSRIRHFSYWVVPG